MKYCIIETTDLYHAERRAGFTRDYNRGIGIKVLAEHLDLREAQKLLLEYFRRAAENDGYPGNFPNWGVAVNWKLGGFTLNAHPTHRDGTRSYEGDVFAVMITEEAVKY